MTAASLVWALLLGLAWLLPRHWPTPDVPIDVRELAPDALPRLELSMLVRDFLLIKELRDRALEDKFLFRSKNDMMPGFVESEGRFEKVKIRLKGDFVDHFDSEKWSWRVHVSGGGQVLGLRRFSLQAPDTRFFHWEQLFFQRLREEGLLAPRYDFVRLGVNGEDVGLMALEEHFSKELLEAQRRREGVMIRFDEDEFWRERKQNHPVGEVVQALPARQEYNWQMAEARPFREPTIAGSPTAIRHAALARGLLRALQADTLSAAEIFDVELMGRFLALHELFGFWHGLRWHNIRFYLNPITLKLEPIAFDATSYSRGVSGFLFGNPALLFAGRVASDPDIYSAYRTELDRLLQEPAARELMAALNEAEAAILRGFRSEGEDAPRLAPRMARRINQLRSGIAMKRGRPPRRILTRSEIAASRLTGREGPPLAPGKAYTGAVYALVSELADGRQQIELLTSSREDALVRDLQIAGAAETESILTAAGLTLPLRLPGNKLDVTPQRLVLPLPSSIRVDPQQVSGVATLASHGSRGFPFEGRASVAALTSPPLPEHALLNELLLRHPFLKWHDREGGSFVIGAGDWSVTSALVIPKRLHLPDGSTVESPGLKLEAGTRLSFARDSYLHVWGTLDARGSPSQPIELHGMAGESWLGIVVFGQAAHSHSHSHSQSQSQSQSRLDHVRISGATATSMGPWQLTGGITFYQARVAMNDVLVENSLSEDAINLIDSDFEFRRVVVVNAHSDGLDSDFSRGKLTNCRFEDIAGDAVDLSGSQVEAIALQISGVGDKAVSVGERSHFESRGLRIEGVSVGVVSKDDSRVRLVETVARDVGYAALMSYRKKPEYGPAQLASTGLDFDDSARLAIAERGSEILIDGAPVAVVELDVEQLYRFGFMRRDP